MRLGSQQKIKISIVRNILFLHDQRAGWIRGGQAKASDGFLATFALSMRDRNAVCTDTLTAAEQLPEILPRFNTERRTTGKPTLDFGVALHLGEVLYANIGSSERLDLTVVGSAVNEATRIEGLCRHCSHSPR
jgi:class 3 adenylate cyclase